jgi:hypothetical protein
MKTIHYAGKDKNKIFKISDESYNEVTKYKWYLNRGYANTKFKGKNIKLQRLLTKCSPNLQVDHIDGDKSNYQLDNLRCVTISQNQANQKIRGKGSSKYKGVIWLGRIQKWVAQIQFQYKRTHIGVFNSEKEAALAYDKKAKELFGEFAKLNLS